MNFLTSPHAKEILPAFLLLLAITAAIGAADLYQWFKSRQRGKDNSAP